MSERCSFISFLTHDEALTRWTLLYTLHKYYMLKQEDTANQSQVVSVGGAFSL